MPTKNAATKHSWKFLLRSDISWPTYVLIVVFGLGSWIAVNGLWVELPILVKFAPEKWDLPSYLTVIVQLANVGPLAYSIGNHFAPRSISEKPVVLLIVLIGSVSCALLAFFWNKTSFVGGVEHSTALLVLSFCLAIVDCTSSVVFLTFMGLFPSSYMSALFVGETMSGMLPSFVALGQGVAKGSSASCNKTSQNITNTSSSHHNADTGLKFGPEPFFFFLFSMMIACGLAFMGLNYLPFAKKQHVRTISQRSGEEERQWLIRSDSFAHHENGAENFSTETHSTSFSSFTHHHVIYLLCIQAWINCLSNGVVSSIQAYAYEPYGNETYHLGTSRCFLGCVCVLGEGKGGYIGTIFLGGRGRGEEHWYN